MTANGGDDEVKFITGADQAWAGAVLMTQTAVASMAGGVLVTASRE